MLITILTWLFVVWLSVAVVLTILVGFSIYQLGGWSDMVEFLNKFTLRGHERKMTVLEVQWVLVLSITFWPIILPLGQAVKKRDKGS